MKDYWNPKQVFTLLCNTMQAIAIPSNSKLSASCVGRHRHALTLRAVLQKKEINAPVTTTNLCLGMTFPSKPFLWWKTKARSQLKTFCFRRDYVLAACDVRRQASPGWENAIDCPQCRLSQARVMQMREEAESADLGRASSQDSENERFRKVQPQRVIRQASDNCQKKGTCSR